MLPKYRDVAMVFQSYALYPHMTIAENIGYPLKLRGVPKAELAAQIRAAAEKVHLEDYLDRYPRQLSGGQRQRVALARAIVRRPSVFLMDEPLSNLDAKLRTFMRAELKRLQGDLGTTTIYVTHDQIEAMTLAHRVAVMNKGVVQQIATPARDLRQPGQPLRRRLHRLAADEHACRAPSPTAPSSPGGPRPCRGLRAARRRRSSASAPRTPASSIPADADLKATIYASELTGNETVVTCQVGKEQVVVKTDKSFDLPVDTAIGLAIDRAKLRLFDAATGDRIAAA